MKKIRNISIVIVVVLLVGFVAGIMVAPKFAKKFKGDYEGRLVKQNGNVLTIEKTDNKIEEVQLIFREGSRIEISGERQNSKINVEKLEANSK